MKISTTAWQQLLDSIATNAYASSHLDLSQLGLNSKNAMELAKALESNYSIKSLDVHDNKIGDAGFKELINNTTLTSLDISHNVIGHPDAKGLANNAALLKLGLEPTYVFNLPGLESLATNKSLTHLNISDNALNDTGAEVLAQALSKSSLGSLNIGNNNLHDASVITLAKCTNLYNLDLSYNFVLSKGINALAENTTLTALNLSNISKIDANNYNEVVSSLVHLMENTTLTSLDLHSDHLSSANAYVKTQEYKVEHFRANGYDSYWTSSSLQLKQSLLEILLCRQDFCDAFFNNTTLIDFNIQDQVWDNAAYTKLLGSFQGTRFFIAPSQYIDSVETHLIDNLSKMQDQTSLHDSILDTENFESNTLVLSLNESILDAAQDLLENTHLNTDLDNHHLETSDTVIFKVPNIEINHDTLDDLTHDHAIPNEPISTAESENSLATDTSVESFTIIDNMDVILQPNDLASLLESSNLFDTILENTFDNTNEIAPSTNISLVHVDNPIEVTPFVEQATLTDLGLNTDVIPEYALS